MWERRAQPLFLGVANNFTNPQISIGYGANVRYQFNHYFALQADFIGGQLKGNNDDELGNGQRLPTELFSLLKQQ